MVEKHFSPHAGQHSSHNSLNEKSGIASALFPEFTGEVGLNLHFLILTTVNVEAFSLHLSSEFSFHFYAFCCLEMGLSLTIRYFLKNYVSVEFKLMFVLDLVCLSKGMMVDYSGFRVAIATKIRLGNVGMFNDDLGSLFFIGLLLYIILLGCLFHLLVVHLFKLL